MNQNYNWSRNFVEERVWHQCQKRKTGKSQQYWGKT